MIYQYPHLKPWAFTRAEPCLNGNRFATLKDRVVGKIWRSRVEYLNSIFKEVYAESVPALAYENNPLLRLMRGR